MFSFYIYLCVAMYSISPTISNCIASLSSLSLFPREAMEAMELRELENSKSSALQPCGLPRSWHTACIGYLYCDIFGMSTGK